MNRYIRGNIKFTSRKWYAFEVSCSKREIKFVIDGTVIVSYKQERFYRLKQFIKRLNRGKS